MLHTLSWVFMFRPIPHVFSVFGVRFKVFIFRSKPKTPFLKWWRWRQKIKVFTIMSSRYKRHCGEQSGRCRHISIIWSWWSLLPVVKAVFFFVPLVNLTLPVSWYEVNPAELWTVYKMDGASALPSRSECRSTKYCSSSFGCLRLAPEKSKSHLLTFISVQLFKPK